MEKSERRGGKGEGRGRGKRKEREIGIKMIKRQFSRYYL